MSQMTQEEGKTCSKRRFCLNIEGKRYRWLADTITTEQIAFVGCWDPAIGVIQIDEDNNERTLKPGEVVKLEPGKMFCKKTRWKRGLEVEPRIEQELALLRGVYPDLAHQDRWVHIPVFSLPPGWDRPSTEVVFFIRDGFPGVSPYGIYVPVGLRHGGKPPRNYKEPAKPQPPFAGDWGVFSWEAANWRATADVVSGHNLVNWVHGFANRFREGQ